MTDSSNRRPAGPGLSGATTGDRQVTDPVLVHLIDIRAAYTPWETIGAVGKGTRRVMRMTGGTFRIRAVKGGTFDAPATAGIVVAGADYQLVHGPDFAELDVRFDLRTDSGHLIHVRAAGRRYGPPEVIQRLQQGLPVGRHEYYGASAPAIETAAPGLEWMSYRQFIGQSRTEPDAQNLRFFVVDYPA